MPRSKGPLFQLSCVAIAAFAAALIPAMVSPGSAFARGGGGGGGGRGGGGSSGGGSGGRGSGGSGSGSGSGSGGSGSEGGGSGSSGTNGGVGSDSSSGGGGDSGTKGTSTGGGAKDTGTKSAEKDKKNALAKGVAAYLEQVVYIRAVDHRDDFVDDALAEIQATGRDVERQRGADALLTDHDRARRVSWDSSVHPR